MLKKIYENKIPNTVFHLHSNNIKFLRLSSLANTPTTLFSWFSCEKLRLLPTAASRCARSRNSRGRRHFSPLFAWTTRSETCCEQKRRKQVCFSPNRRRVEWARRRAGAFCHAKSWPADAFCVREEKGFSQTCWPEAEIYVFLMHCKHIHHSQETTLAARNFDSQVAAGKIDVGLLLAPWLPQLRTPPAALDPVNIAKPLEADVRSDWLFTSECQ